MLATGRSADDIVSSEGLTQISDDGAILSLVEEVLAKNTDAVTQYRTGKTGTLGFLVGQVMKATGARRIRSGSTNC